KRAYCLKTQPATGETYPKSDLFNKAASDSSVARTSPSSHLCLRWLCGCNARVLWEGENVFVRNELNPLQVTIEPNNIWFDEEVIKFRSYSID
ncbi:hypothetical protein QCN14_11315, partial [Enterobacter roggenkampii]